MESDDEIRAALQAANEKSGIVSRPKPVVKRTPAPEVDSNEVSDVVPKPAPPKTFAKPFRPTLRPPVPLLVVCDDGDWDGETIRLRNERFVIGRNTGDFQLPNDGLVSSRHMEIIRVLSDGRFRWIVADLQSTHGVFFRFTSHQLNDQTEFLVGRSRFRFENPDAIAPGTTDDGSAMIQTDGTIGWSDAPGVDRPPTLVELVRQGLGSRISLAGSEYWIGADPQCVFCKPDDPFLELKHAKIHRHPKRGWVVENNKTANGVWVRKSQHVFDPAKEDQGNSVRFQIGEQQFKLMVQS